MTPEQIEAKALEEFPPEGMKQIESGEIEHDENADLRAAFIKGCQYAAIPSAVTRSEAKEWAKRRFPSVPIGPDMWMVLAKRNAVTEFFDYLQGKALSPSQPVAGLQWVKASTWPSNGTDKHWRHPSGEVIEWQNAFDQLTAETPFFTPEYLSESYPAQPGYSREQVEEAISLAQEMTDWAVSFKHTTEEIFKLINNKI